MTCTFSFPVPYKMGCNCSMVYSPSGFEESSPQWLQTACNICAEKELGSELHGKIPPSSIERSPSITRSGSISILKPRPAQAGQAPYGLLNENIRGVISSKLTPQSGQAKLSEKMIGSPPMTSMTTMPLASCSAVSKESARREAISDFTTRRSMTTSISCFFCFSSLISSVSSCIAPLTMTRT